MYRRITIYLVTLLLTGGASSATPAEQLYFACHAGVSLVDADVRDVFLGEKQFANSIRLVPVDNVAAQLVFLDKVLKMNGAKYATTWAKKSFRDGIMPPAVMANDDAVLEFIRRTPGGCGYLGIEPRGDITVIGRY